ncbi:amino acid transporter [Fistulina hepatica ATCC 64428]|uniref:Amino acid transporter n=1 Tax=Fistulina hepatica ATCC 64428 TaxID=1128425 RepID=A0A0D7AMF9_9AGAR|nr:amino acid transporter [Fistulina hepatica ATCC 64428]
MSDLITAQDSGNAVQNTRFIGSEQSAQKRSTIEVREASGERSADSSAVEDLKKLGYEQELTRARGLSHILFTYGLAAPIATSLVSGGPATMIWGWILTSLLVMTLALSLAEIAAKYPTSAGAYYWVYRLAPPRYRLLLSYITGWLTLIGVWTISLSVTFGTAQIIVAGVQIYHPDWEPEAWKTYLIFLAVIAVTSFFCLFLNDILPTLDILSAYWLLLVIMICLSVKAAAGRHSAAYAFSHFDTSYSGWTPGWAFFIGLFPVSLISSQAYYLITMFFVFHLASMAEEVHNPAHNIPRAIFWSVPIGTVMGVVFTLPILFTLPDIGVLLAVSSGQPLGLMFELIMGSRGGGFGMILYSVFGVAMFCAISISCAASRATWSFARDRAIPFHTVFAQVNHRLSDVPINAFLLSTAVQVLLGLIYLGSSAAFNAFVGVEVMCLQSSYALPVAISLAGGRRAIADSPYFLGRWGVLWNTVAVLWVLFQIVLFSMPATLPVTPTTMNYASVVFVFFALFSTLWYLVNGRFHYRGPPIPFDTSSALSSSEPEKANHD